MTTAEELKALGLESAADQLSKREQAAEKWAMAYAHYPFVTPEQVQAFRDLCKKEINNGAVKTLALTPLAKYPNIPPREVLDKLKEAKDRQAFDTFEVAHIEWVVPVPDPILFGRIKDCPDYFLIAQWGDDVKFEEIAK